MASAQGGIPGIPSNYFFLSFRMFAIVWALGGKKCQIKCGKCHFAQNCAIYIVCYYLAHTHTWAVCMCSSIFILLLLYYTIRLRNEKRVSLRRNVVYVLLLSTSRVQKKKNRQRKKNTFCIQYIFALTYIRAPHLTLFSTISRPRFIAIYFHLLYN